MLTTRCSCGSIRVDGKCSRCKFSASDEHALSRNKRGYDWQWKKFRREYLKKNPTCVDCWNNNGIAILAKELHHVVKISVDPRRRLDVTNVMALCSECHVKRTAKGE